MDALTAKKLQAKLEEQISDWSLQRLRLERRLKYIRGRMIVVGTLIIALQAIRIFIPQLTFPPYNSIATLALSVWLIFIVAKYAIGYKDKRCTRSADQIVKLAAEYNEAIKDIPDARRCDFLPPEVFRPKRFRFKERERVSAQQTPTLPPILPTVKI